MVWPDQLLAEGEDIQVNNLEYFYSVNFQLLQIDIWRAIRIYSFQQYK